MGFRRSGRRGEQSHALRAARILRLRYCGSNTAARMRRANYCVQKTYTNPLICAVLPEPGYLRRLTAPLLAQEIARRTHGGAVLERDRPRDARAVAGGQQRVHVPLVPPGDE